MHKKTRGASDYAAARVMRPTTSDTRRWVKTGYGMKKVDRLNMNDMREAIETVETVDDPVVPAGQDDTAAALAHEWVETSRRVEQEPEPPRNFENEFSQIIVEYAKYMGYGDSSHVKKLEQLELELSETKKSEKRLRRQRDLFYQRCLEAIKGGAFDIFGLVNDYEAAYDNSCDVVTPVDELGIEYQREMVALKFQMIKARN